MLFWILVLDSKRIRSSGVGQWMTNDLCSLSSEWFCDLRQEEHLAALPVMKAAASRPRFIETVAVCVCLYTCVVLALLIASYFIFIPH